ncbi:unnamed protein product, partial [Mesorhabditis spiculigera]
MTTEREQLSRLVKQWNENRLDLFHLTQPTEDLEIEGVMRFYFQDVGERVSTKCIRVSSTATTRAVIDALVEKFVPDLKMLTVPEYSLFREVPGGGEERKLDLEEKPLVVQLMWHRDDREGRFLLKKHDSQYLPLSALQLHDDKDSSVLPSAFQTGKELKKKHQGIGGSLKVYGAELDATRTYVTLLVSMRDRAAQILREALKKHFPTGYQKIRWNDLNVCALIFDSFGSCAHINHEFQIANRPPGAPEVFFHIRRRPSHYNRVDFERIGDISRGLPSRGWFSRCLLPVMDGVTGSGPTNIWLNSRRKNIILRATGVPGRHCVINFEQGVVTLTPSASDSYIEGKRPPDRPDSHLNEGDLIRWVLNACCDMSILRHTPTICPRRLFHISCNNEDYPAPRWALPPGRSQAENAESANPGYETPQIAQPMTNIPQGPPMSIQVSDYKECDKAEELLFWLANAGELSFLVDSDCEIRPLAQQQGDIVISPCSMLL